MNPSSRYNPVHKFIPMPQAMKIPDAKAALEKEWEKLEKFSAWQLTEVRNKNEVIAEARNEGRKVHFASLLDVCHLKNSELEPRFQKYKGRVVLRGDIVNDGCKSNGRYIKACRMRRTSIRCSIRLHPGQNGRCTFIAKNSKVRIFGYVYQNTNGPNHGPVWKIQSFLWSDICTVIFCQDCYGKGNLRTSC